VRAPEVLEVAADCVAEGTMFLILIPLSVSGCRGEKGGGRWLGEVGLGEYAIGETGPGVRHEERGESEWVSRIKRRSVP
jgi:hypothetical protein